MPLLPCYACCRHYAFFAALLFHDADFRLRHYAALRLRHAADDDTCLSCLHYILLRAR